VTASLLAYCYWQGEAVIWCTPIWFWFYSVIVEPTPPQLCGQNIRYRHTVVALQCSVILPALFVRSCDISRTDRLPCYLQWHCCVEFADGVGGLRLIPVTVIYLLLMTVFWIALGAVKNRVDNILHVCQHFFSSICVHQWSIMPDFINKRIDACARNCDQREFFLLNFLWHSVTIWQNCIPRDSHRKTCGSAVCVSDRIHTQLNNNNQHFHVGHDSASMWIVLAAIFVSSQHDINCCLVRC